MSDCFVMKKCFTEKSKLATISKQPAREILMLLWAFLILEADEGIGFPLEAIADKSGIPVEIVKLGFSLFLQLGMIEQRENNQQPAQDKQDNGPFQKIRSLLAGTPLDKVTDSEIKELEEKYGKERLELVCEIAAEIWKRTKKEIRSPKGYLYVMCGSLKVPDWFTPKNETGGRQQSKLDDFWESLSEQERQNHLLRAKNSMPESMKNAPPEAIDAVAKQNAWNEHLFDWVREQL
jgi:hypothetical protein